MAPKLPQAVQRIAARKAVESYASNGSKLAGNGMRSGLSSTPAVAARGVDQANNHPGAPGAPPAPPAGSGGALAAIASGIATAIGWEQALTAPIGAIPFPGLPALCVGDIAAGLPHAHNHPPNITPPNPVPVPLPSVGPVIPIPYLSGASNTKHGGSSAARCGDMGLGAWCGGYFPMYEVFLGSASVWIEGARAARLGIDITKHCIFTSPKPTDPPLGPMVGATFASGCGNVLIGGAPLPSLFSLAIAQIMKGVMKVGSAAFRKATAKAKVDKLISQGKIVLNGSQKYADDVLEDLYKMASTRTGRQALNRIDKAGKTVTIQPFSKGYPNGSCAPASWDAVVDTTGKAGSGSDSVIEHSPELWSNKQPPGTAHPHPGTTSDALLNHEMQHSANAADGKYGSDKINSEHDWPDRWKNHEEYSTTHADNGYRRETGLPERTNYADMP